LEIQGYRSIQWGHLHNTIFDRKKANFMVLTHQKLTIRLFLFGDISLPPSTQVKYLGILLNPKLSFKAHLDKVKKSGETTLNQLIRISRCSYGIGIQQSRNLIISVLRSRILFGSIVWATTRNEASVKNMINKLYNAAVRVTLGMFRTTPIEVLTRESPLIPFIDVLKRKNHSFLIKKLTDPLAHPVHRLVQFEVHNHQRHHPSPIHSILDNHLISKYKSENIETIHQHLIRPWDDFHIETYNLNVKKEDAKEKVESQLKEIDNKNEHVLFTDGSNIPEQGTASAAILNRAIPATCRINDDDKASAFEAEVLAVKIGLETIINKLYDQNDSFRNESKKINLFIDNQATILSIVNPPKPKSNQTTLYDIYMKMKLLIDLFDFNISIFWCPAHVNISENEAVDKLAKEATEGNLRRLRDPHCTLSNVQQIIKKNFRFEKEKKNQFTETTSL
jgi:ribonuclease HI